jgi:3D-(3,5/4)-trihydroxycyclohexane-1,2-dione acylhydrolase (decyclizing)
MRRSWAREPHGPERPTLIAAAGGMPGEVVKNWRVKGAGHLRLRVRLSCMGYEIAAGWGMRWPRAARGTPIVMVGDGTYMMMNSDIYSSVLTGHKMIVVVCDNGGFAVINRLQTSSRACRASTTCSRIAGSPKEPVRHVDFAKHAESHGGRGAALRKPRRSRGGDGMGAGHGRTTVISITPTPMRGCRAMRGLGRGRARGVGRESVRAARKAQEAIRAKQRVGV